LFKNSGTGVIERVEKPSRRRINGYVVMKYLSKNEPRKRVVSVRTKEDIREQPTSRNLSANATKVLQCTCPVAAPRKYFSAISALYCCQFLNFRSA
jgi:hypothetical protein